MQIDPDLQLYTSPQNVSEHKENFGVFTDFFPDRWGRLLLKRREAILARQEISKLYESDFLLSVIDDNRLGGIRFKIDSMWNYLNDNEKLAIPPSSSLLLLEATTSKLEEDGIKNSKDYLKWLNMLITPCSSLGGARPKSNIVNDNNNLWIA
ncbi:MAG: hypothetical protein JKX98_06625 [Alcanivoracaceae bacterium]|nr:hypothetical protein [Alcanivoracaceae bacterium]